LDPESRAALFNGWHARGSGALNHGVIWQLMDLRLLMRYINNKRQNDEPPQLPAWRSPSKSLDSPSQQGIIERIPDQLSIRAVPAPVANQLRIPDPIPATPLDVLGCEQGDHRTYLAAVGRLRDVLEAPFVDLISDDTITPVRHNE